MINRYKKKNTRKEYWYWMFQWRSKSDKTLSLLIPTDLRMIKKNTFRIACGNYNSEVCIGDVTSPV